MSTDVLIDIDNARSYSTEARLAAGLKRLGLDGPRSIVVCNRSGRFTAIFTVAQCHLADVPVISVAQAGFPVVN